MKPSSQRWKGSPCNGPGARIGQVWGLSTSSSAFHTCLLLVTCAGSKLIHHGKYGDARLALWVNFLYWAKVTMDTICQWLFLLRFPTKREVPGGWKCYRVCLRKTGCPLPVMSQGRNMGTATHGPCRPRYTTPSTAVLHRGRPAHTWGRQRASGQGLLGFHTRSLSLIQKGRLGEERGRQERTCARISSKSTDSWKAYHWTKTFPEH